MTTAVDIVNLALTRIKYTTPIGSFFEGSTASRVAVQVYAQTRDALFSSKDWEFLRKEVSLGNPVKTAPAGGYGATPWDPTTNPVVPWIYEYFYPADCIEIRSLRPTPVFIPEFAPQFTRFVTAFDSPNKVVLTNLYQPLANITARVVDPDEWQDAMFTETLIDALAVQFEKHFGDGDPNKINLAERDTAQAMAVADTRRG